MTLHEVVEVLQVLSLFWLTVGITLAVWHLPDLLKQVTVLLKTQAAYNDRRLVDAFRDGVYPANVVPPHQHFDRRVQTTPTKGGTGDSH
jgi:hypothetical protein